MAARGVYTLVFSTWPVIRIPQKCLSLTHQSMPMSPYYSLINLFVHLKVSEVLAIIVKKSLFTFCHSSRHKHHLDFKDEQFFLIFSFYHLPWSCSLEPFQLLSLASKTGEPSSRSPFQHDPAPHFKHQAMASLFFLFWIATFCSILVKIFVLLYQRFHLIESKFRERAHFSSWRHLSSIELNTVRNLRCKNGFGNQMIL